MTTTTEASTEATTTAANLRLAADFLDAHPGLPVANVTAFSSGTTQIAWYLEIHRRSNDEQLDAARAIRRAIGGTWGKSTSDTALYLRQKRDGLDLVVTCSRDAACVRRVVGHEDVTIPAVPARPEHAERREIVEWDCGPILGADIAESAVSA